MTAGVGKSDTFENDLLKLIFNNVAIADIGDAGGLRATATAGSLWWALYTADPTEEGTAISNETAYTNYVRVAAARASGAGGFTVTGNSVSPPRQHRFRGMRRDSGRSDHALRHRQHGERRGKIDVSRHHDA